MRVSEATAKRLFAVSSNRCAFPKCPTPLVEAASGKVTGRICHIKARRPEGPRFDPKQTEEERHAFDNLILMCPVHHDVIDSDIEAYTVERLERMKMEHESETTEESVASVDLLNALISLSDVEVQQGSVLVAINPSGGQIAHNILNIQPTGDARQAVLEPVVKRVPHERSPQFSTLEVRLRNVGNAKPADARVTLSFPQSMNRHTTQDGLKRIRVGRVVCERDNGFFYDQNLFQQLHPGDFLEQTVLGIHYHLERENAVTCEETFDIQVRTGDRPAFLSRLTFGQLESLPADTWYALGPATEGHFSEAVPL